MRFDWLVAILLNDLNHSLISLLNFYWPSIVDRFILVKSIKNCHYFIISYVVTAAHCFSENNPDNFAVAPESLTLAFGLDNITVLEDPILPTKLKIQKRTINVSFFLGLRASQNGMKYLGGYL